MEVLEEKRNDKRRNFWNIRKEEQRVKIWVNTKDGLSLLEVFKLRYMVEAKL